MILVRLNGGLGNQLFQYAAGFSLAKKNCDELKIDVSAFDDSCRGKDTRRSADILQFSIAAPIANRFEVEGLRNSWGALSRIARFVRQRIFKRYYSDWHPEILSLNGDVYLDGYFQCENYFSDYLDLIVREFSLLAELEAQIAPLRQKIDSLHNPVSLHVRRGDYVSDPKIRALHNICTVNYYEKALAQMREKVGSYDLVVFSDDVPWVRENLKLGADVLYVSDQNIPSGQPLSAPQELTLMAHCRHHVISNSTFSWWGAYLNRRADKIVIAPGLWNRSRIDSHKNILPELWLRIPLS